MSSLIKKFLPIALGVAAPGIGTALGISSLAGTTALGAGLGAAGGALSGGGLKGALLGGLGGGVGGYLGYSPTSLGSAATSEGLLNASTGSVSGFNQAALGGSSGLTSALKAGISNLGSASKIGDITSAIGAMDTQDEMKKKLLIAQNMSKDALSPYLSAGQSGIESLQSGFDPSQLQNDAGYQFRLQQGQDALEKSLAARGMSSSGAAMKAAQEYGQGTAAQAYNDAYSQWLAKNSGLANYGQNATGTLTKVYDNIGDIGSTADVAKSNILSSTLSSLLRNSSGKQIIGRDKEGNPIYAG